MKRIFRLRNGLYPTEFLAGVGVPFESFRRSLAKARGKGHKSYDGDEPMGLVDTDADSLVVGVWISGEPKGAERADVIAHEALHASMVSLTRSGVSCGADNQEPLCYHLGWLVYEITKRCSR